MDSDRDRRESEHGLESLSSCVMFFHPYEWELAYIQEEERKDIAKQAERIGKMK
jgi:hypothetical protein